MSEMISHLVLTLLRYIGSIIWKLSKYRRRQSFYKGANGYFQETTANVTTLAAIATMESCALVQTTESASAESVSAPRNGR